ncbi:recombinase family protein [Inquilinus limosus]|uniref:recombinase family protein n=1 Tax=Inquilinus limosus TaxID=171674 RepID=UPI0004178212|nr:recombinase family protein [Inquilinus limosus]
MSTIRADDAPLRRAVQYLRMSTEHQRYSIEHQTAAIAEFAEIHGYEIVGTYADPGRSGLTINGRTALQQLLSDVLKSNPIFDTILVYDVSRWGRFQDPDQSAHYEFICRQAGIDIIYCVEQFGRANTIANNLLKHLKRIMAAEYSRDISAKVCRAHLRLAEKGYWQGGVVPYGFRRLLVDESGAPRMVLEHGQRKALAADRVVVVNGPPQEIDIIRRIFRWYVNEGLSLYKIAERLKSKGISGNFGRAFLIGQIRTVLRSELCVGYYVYNRTTQRLKTDKRKNEKEYWIRAPALTPIIEKSMFQKAQRLLSDPKRMGIPERDLLNNLRRLLREYGEVNFCIIRKDKNSHAPGTFVKRFGSLTEALKRIGYTQPKRGAKDPDGNLWTNDGLLQALRHVHAREGYISHKLINRCRELPSVSVFQRRFGSVRRAAELAGLPRIPDQAISYIAWRKTREAKGIRLKSAFSAVDILEPGPLFSNEYIIEGLRRIRSVHGYISFALIDNDPQMPSAALVQHRFGSLLHAYALAGWEVDRQQLLVERGRRQRRSNTPEAHGSGI